MGDASKGQKRGVDLKHLYLSSSLNPTPLKNIKKGSRNIEGAESEY